MTVLVLLLTVAGLQTLVPVGLLAWLSRRRPGTRLEWLVDVAAVGGTVGAASLVLPWSIVPWFVRYVFGTVGLVLAVRAWRRVGRVPWVERFETPRVASIAARGLHGALMCAVAAYAAAGARPPAGNVIDLACPLAEGRYLVANGGGNRLLNTHLATLGPQPRYAAWRGQSHGLDVVGLNRWGSRAAGVLPSDPSQYAIDGEPVVAPCSGRVVSVADDRPDMPVPMRDPDRTQLAGNHVVIDCAGVEVLLAHMRRGSVQVAGGERVSVGDPLGRVGNSGNTDEPHLHISAQRRRPGQALIGGDPVWVTIGGDFLVRNDRLVCGPR